MKRHQNVTKQFIKNLLHVKICFLLTVACTLTKHVVWEMYCLCCCSVLCPESQVLLTYGIDISSFVTHFAFISSQIGLTVFASVNVVKNYISFAFLER